MLGLKADLVNLADEARTYHQSNSKPRNLFLSERSKKQKTPSLPRIQKERSNADVKMVSDKSSIFSFL